MQVFELKFYFVRSLDYYDDPKCNVMNGTDGTTAGSFLKRESTVYFFGGDSCK